MSRSVFEAAKLAATWPEAKAEKSEAATKAPTGSHRGHTWASRTLGSRSRHSQSRVRRRRAPSERVMEQPSPTTYAARRPRRSAITSIGVAIEEDAADRHGDDLDVEPEGPPLDVLDVVLDACLQRCIAAEPVHLRPPRDAGLDLVAEHVARHGLAEAFHEHGALGARPHHAHLPAQHVHELRQLVEAESAEEGPDGSAAGVPAGRPHRARLALCVHPHGAQLEHAEALAVEPHTLLTVEHGAGRGQLDGGGEHEEQRREDAEQGGGEHDGEDALGDLVPAVE